MLSTKKLLRPDTILLFVAIIQFVIYFLYCLGIVPSFKIEWVSKDVFGYIYLGLYYIIPIFICKISCKSHCTNNVLVCINEEAVLKISSVFTILSIIGMTRLGINLFSKYGVWGAVQHMLTDQNRIGLETGSGNVIMSDFVLASVILLSTIVDFKMKKHIVPYFVSLIVSFMYSSLLISRMIIIEACIFSVLILVRRFYFSFKFSMFKPLLVIIPILLFLIITSGSRDYKIEGKYYTSSKFLWGMSRIVDYSISTTNYSLEIDKYRNDFESSFPYNTLELATKFGENQPQDKERIIQMRRDVGSTEYTNLGGEAQIYMDFNFFTPIIIVIVSIVYVTLYNKFLRNDFLGIILYPIFFYNAIESYRLFYIGTAMAQLLIIIVLISSLVCKKYYSFIPEGSN